MKSALRLLAAAALAINSAGVERCRASGVQADCIEFRTDLVGVAPCPFQAARIRVTVRSIGKEPVGPIVVDDSAGIYLIKGPSETDYKKAWGSRLVRDISRGTHDTARELNNVRYPIFLKRGDACSATCPSAAEWKNESGNWLSNNVGKPLFTKGGAYSIKCRYILEAKPDGSYRYAETTLSIQVREPEGDDKLIYAVLEKNARLASAVMSPQHVPDKDLVDKLSEIVDKYPKSSYVDYARFALARAYFAGNYQLEFNREERVAKGISLLQATAASPFAYQPNVLMVLRNHLRDEAETKKITDWLNREHYDAIEWLEEVPAILGGAVRERVRERSRDLRALINGEPPPPEDVRKVLARQLFENESEENIARLCGEEWRAYRIRPARGR